MSPSSASSSFGSSSRSPSPASSQSSALRAWSFPPSHLPPPPHMNASMSTSTSTADALSTRPPAPPIASFPSLAHSLSAFPTMTAVAHDMVHYGTLGRTKGVSEAKLNSALRKTKQRQDAGPGSTTSAPRAARHPTPEDDDPVLLFVPKRSKAPKSKQSS
ncbi:hypothetical protein BD413DRAFT_611122 [Trametes elegans]|nr:hypothetical protein BD413DRAFT_611122 [Trametes elegans]